MSGSRLRRISDWTVRLGLPLAVLGTVIAVFLGEEMGIDHELNLVTPAQAERGEPLPIRAAVFGRLGAPEGPTLEPVPVEVTLRGPDGATLATTRLAPTPAGDAGGSLDIPQDAPDRVTLRAVAVRDGRGLATATRRFDLSEAAAPAPLAGRAAYATQHLRLGPVERVEGQDPPSALDVRVVGGACVPEVSCEVLVHVGAPAAGVRLSPSDAVTVDGSPGEPTDGLVGVQLTVHGPEAHPRLEARRGGVLVASRDVTLPVALATPGLIVRERALDAPARPTIEAAVLGDRAGVIVDAYRDGRWRRTGAVAASDEPFEVPFAPLEAGLWRLQIRTDPFGAQRAASRVIAVGIDLEEARARIDAIARAEGGEESGVPEGPDALRLAWAAESIEVGHRALPDPVRGVEQDRAALAERQRTLRVVAFVAMVLGLLVLLVVFLRRGVDAARQASRVMEATGDPELTSPAHQRRTLLSSLAIVATVVLAFLAAGAMIVARARLLE